MGHLILYNLLRRVMQSQPKPNLDAEKQKAAGQTAGWCCGCVVLVAAAMLGPQLFGGCGGDPNWESAVGKIEAGVTVYMKATEDSEPEPWFTVIEPYVEGNDGPMMKVRYAATGDVEYLDRRATMRSPAAVNGLLVIPRR